MRPGVKVNGQPDLKNINVRMCACRVVKIRVPGPRGCDPNRLFCGYSRGLSVQVLLWTLSKVRFLPLSKDVFSAQVFWWWKTIFKKDLIPAPKHTELSVLAGPGIVESWRVGRHQSAAPRYSLRGVRSPLNDSAPHALIKTREVSSFLKV